MQLISRSIIYDADAAPDYQKCVAFISLVKLSDDSLLCSFTVGPEKVSSSGNICIMRSTDGGMNWQPLYQGFESTYEATPGSFCGGYLFEVEPGRLMITLFWVDRSDPKLPLSNPQTTGLLPFKTLLAESNDGGASWSDYREISLKPHRGTSVTGEIIRLNDGPLLQPYECWKEWDDTEATQSANLRLSNDESKTWSEPVTLACDPDQQHYFWDTRLSKHPQTGRIAAMFWTHHAITGLDEDIHLSWSDPTGRNWSQPKSTGIAGQVAAPLALGGDDLLCVYVHRHDPPSMRVVLSHDLGKTWLVQEELIIYEGECGPEAGGGLARSEQEAWADMYRWTFGHPKAVRLDDPTVLVTFYGGDPDALSIHGCVIKID